MGQACKVRGKLGGDVLGEGLEEELTGAEAAVAEAPQVTLQYMVPKGARASERGLTGPPGAHCRVAPQSQIHIGTNSKHTIFALFWPENASN